MAAWEVRHRRAKVNIHKVRGEEPKAMAPSPRPPPGLQQEAISAYGMLREADQVPSLSGSVESPYLDVRLGL